TLFLHAGQENLRIIGIERLAFLHRPNAVDLRLAVEIEAHQRQLAHRVLRARIDVHHDVDRLLFVIDFAIAGDLGIEIPGAPHRGANAFDTLAYLVHIRHVASLEVARLEQRGGSDRRWAGDLDLAEIIADALIEGDENVDAFGLLRRLGANLGERDAQASPLLVDAAHRVIEDLAESAFGVRAADRDS